MTAESVHASAALVGARAVLIRGDSGAGKSALLLRLLQAPQHGLLPFARLVGDDRVLLSAAHGRLMVRPAPALAGLVEIRGFGIARLPFEPLATVGLVVDLAKPEAERMPAAAGQTTILGVTIPHCAFPPDVDPLPALVATLGTPLRG